MIDDKNAISARGLSGITVVLLGVLVMVMIGALLTYNSLAVSWSARVGDIKEQLEKCEARKDVFCECSKKELGQCYKDQGDALSESELCDQGFLQVTQLLKDCEKTLEAKGCVLDKMTSPGSGP